LQLQVLRESRVLVSLRFACPEYASRLRVSPVVRRVLSGRHLSKHGTDREEYMDEYGLSPDELIAKDFRIIQSSRRGYQPYGKREWIATVKKIHKSGGRVGAADLQHKNQNLYHLGVWIFGDWDTALRAARIDNHLAGFFERH
jgi:hypothetical protein